MVRRRITTQDTNLCQATGTIKGKSITVSLVPALTEEILRNYDHFGGLFARSWDTVPNDIKQPTISSGSMCPGTFHADGYGFDVTFDVGVVRRKVGGRTTSMFDITFIALGERADERVKNMFIALRENADGGLVKNAFQVKNIVKPPDLSLISRPGLLRLALKAAAIKGVAYPLGWTTDLQGKYITTLKAGDSPPTGNVKIYGAILTRSQSTGKITVALDPSPEVKVKSGGDNIDENSMRDLIGQVHVGRPKLRGSMTDPKVLKLVAKYYRYGEHRLGREAGESLPAYVLRRLLEHDIVQSESWVRQVGVAARKAGYLEQGKRNKPTAKDKR